MGPFISRKGVNGKNKEKMLNDVEAATLLNEYFISVNNKKENNVGRSNKLKKKNLELIDEKISITEGEVVKAIGEFKNQKSPGVDNISSTYALNIKNIVAMPLAYIFEKSLNNNEIPRDWKLANVTPIFKKGDKSNVENYRPVSLTVIFGKTMEKIIKVHIEKFLQDHEIVDQDQHGFTKGRSCLSNLLIFQKSVIDMLDDGYSVDIIYLDLQKAFDKVPHDKMIGKIRGLGMNEKIVEWIENWLEDRMQRVGINGFFSEWVKVESGVPKE